MEYEEFEKMMHEKYPRMFSQPYGGFAIGKGWYQVIHNLCANIDHHIKWRRDQRARDLRLNRAIAKGRDAVTKFVCRGKEIPTRWDEERIEQYLAEGPVDLTPRVNYIHVRQIKEKFGGLRFYYDGGDEAVRGMVALAEAWADNSCEVCGNVGTRRDGGWVRTLCDTHEAEHQAKRKEQGY